MTTPTRAELERRFADFVDEEIYERHAAGLTEAAYEVAEAELRGRGLPVPNRPELQSDDDEEEKEGEKKGMIVPIERREAAQEAVKNYSSGFYVLAAIQGAIGYFFSIRGRLIDAFIFALLATVLRFWISRTAAILLILNATAAVFITVMIHIEQQTVDSLMIRIEEQTVDLFWWSDMIVALLAFWFAVKSVEATFKFHRRFAETATPPILARILCLTLLVGGFAGGLITDSWWAWGAFAGGLAIMSSGFLDSSKSPQNDSPKDRKTD